jgi:hypothetical protein
MLMPKILNRVPICRHNLFAHHQLVKDR